MPADLRPPPVSSAPDRGPSIPALDRLGDQLTWAAASAIERDRRPATGSWTWALVPLLVVLVLLSVTAVRVAPSAEATVVGAADRTAAHATGRFVLATHTAGARTATDPADPTGPIDLVVRGDYDRSTGRVRSAVDLTRLPGIGAAVAANGTGQVTTMQDGTTLYLQSELFTSSLPSHPTWVRVDLSRLDPAALGGVALEDGLTDPSGFLDLLRGLGDDTVVVDRVLLDGLPTTHYRGTVDLAAAAADLPPADRDRVLDSFARLGLEPAGGRLPVEAWVDEAGSVRRVRAELDLDPSAPGNEAVDATTVTVDYADLGAPAPITLPDPTTAVDITSMVGPLVGRLGGSAPR